MAERRLPKPIMWVRFPSPAPKNREGHRPSLFFVRSDGNRRALRKCEAFLAPAFVKRRENAARSASSRRIFCKRIPITRPKRKWKDLLWESTSAAWVFRQRPNASGRASMSADLRKTIPITPPLKINWESKGVPRLLSKRARTQRGAQVRDASFAKGFPSPAFEN